MFRQSVCKLVCLYTGHECRLVSLINHMARSDLSGLRKQNENRITRKSVIVLNINANHNCSRRYFFFIILRQ